MSRYSTNCIAQYNYSNRPQNAPFNLPTWLTVIVMLLAPGCGERLADDAGDGIGDTVSVIDPTLGSGGRRELIEFDCDALVCTGRWDGSERWSAVFDADAFVDLQAIPPPWVCEPAVDVDICVEVDPQGHIGCFWFQDGWAVAVAPHCATSGDLWLDVGNGMSSVAN